MKCFMHHLWVLDLYTEGSGEPLRVFKQGNGMKRSTFEFKLSGSSVGVDWKGAGLGAGRAVRRLLQ